MTCVEPYPYEKLFSIPQIKVVKKEVQDVELSIFEELDAGDILFIDSTHIVKVDGDVPYLFLEVLPRLKKGVIIHVHDISFPYNVPYPPELYIFNRYKWPTGQLECLQICSRQNFMVVSKALDSFAVTAIFFRSCRKELSRRRRTLV